MPGSAVETMSPEPEDADTSAAETVDERVKLHHEDNAHEAIAGIMEAEESEATHRSQLAPSP